MTRPAASAAPASGTVIERNSCRSDAPSTRAASSMSRSTPAIPVRADRMKNGADTNVWARITATVVNGTENPSSSNGAASNPRRPNTSSRASPATDGGNTIGRSTTASIRPFAPKRRRARTKASGIPSATVITRLIAVVTRLSHSASRTTGEATATASDPSTTDRTTSVATGSPRNSANRRATAVSDRSPHPDRRALAAPTEGGFAAALPPGAAASLITTGAGTRSP